MSSLLLTVVILFLIGALFLALVEGHGGYMGDSSMVPGYLILGVVILAIIVAVGFVTGNVIIQVR